MHPAIRLYRHHIMARPSQWLASHHSNLFSILSLRSSVKKLEQPSQSFKRSCNDLRPSAPSRSPNVKKFAQREKTQFNVDKSKPYRDNWRRQILMHTTNSSCIFKEQDSPRQTISVSMKGVDTVSNKELIAVVEKLSSAYMQGERNSADWRKIYDVLSRRVDGLTKHEAFYVLDCAYVCNHYSPRFLWLLTYCWAVKGVEALQLTRDDILHMVFYVAVTQDISTEFFAMCEDFIQDNINEFSALELSMICTSFFSGNISFRSYATLTKLAQFIISQPSDALNHVMVTNFLKAFRHAKFSNVSFFEQLADLLSEKSFSGPQSLSPLTNIATTYGKMRVRHEKLFSGILQAAEMSIKDPFRSYRGKDLAEILSACATLQIPVPESFIQVMLQDLLDPQKDYFVHNALENAALALGILGYLPTHLIDMVLSSPKASAAKQPNREAGTNVWHTLHYIDAIAETLGDGYQGWRLKPQHEWMQDGLGAMELNLERRDGFLPLLWALRNILGDDYVAPAYVLNTFQIPDILIHLDSNHVPLKTKKYQIKKEYTPPKDNETYIKDQFIKGGVPSSGTFELPSNFVSLSPCRTGAHRRLSIKVLSFNQYTANTPRMITGQCMLEITLLNKLGYDVLAVWPVDAVRMRHMTETQLPDYVRSHILKPLGVNAERNTQGLK